MRAVARQGGARATFENPVVAGAPADDHGDPFVVKYLDEFFLYHSGETMGRRGISVYRSRDLVDWRFAGYALEAAESGWAWSDLWAPEVVYERGVFYMYVSATRRWTGTGQSTPWQQGESDDAGRRLGVARATSPLGPFVLDEQPLLDAWAIDGHPFRDDDGRMWLFYNAPTAELAVDGALPGTGTVCDRLLEPDRLAGNPVPVTLPSEQWEGVPTGDWYWNEAPYVMKRRGRYYQLYSGGAFSDASYATGFADARSPVGPWRKRAGNPILRSTGRVLGPGHVSFVFGPDAATRYAVYHGYVGEGSGRKVLLDRFFWAGDRPLIAGPTDGPQARPPEAVFDPAVPHWRAEAWVRGSWVAVAGVRLPLEPADVWHQLEIVQADGRYAVRVGGVLRASRPGIQRAAMLTTDGEVALQTVTSCLQDEEVHDLPAGSAYVWRWGGKGPIEVSVAVRGTVELTLDDRRAALFEGDGDVWRLERSEHDGPAAELALRALDRGASVADVCVYARD